MQARAAKRATISRVPPNRPCAMCPLLAARLAALEAAMATFRSDLSETRAGLAATTARLTASEARLMATTARLTASEATVADISKKYVTKRVHATTTRAVARVSAELDHLCVTLVLRDRISSLLPLLSRRVGQGHRRFKDLLSSDPAVVQPVAEVVGGHGKLVRLMEWHQRAHELAHSRSQRPQNHVDVDVTCGNTWNAVGLPKVWAKTFLALEAFASAVP